MFMSVALAISLWVLVIVFLAGFLVCYFGEEIDGNIPVIILFALIVTVYIAYTGTFIENPSDVEAGEQEEVNC